MLKKQIKKLSKEKNPAKLNKEKLILLSKELKKLKKSKIPINFFT